MTIGLVQTPATGHATAGAVTATLGAAPTDGNLLVAVFGNGSTATGIPTPAGYSTAVVRASGFSTAVGIFYKVAASDPASLSLTPSSGASYDLHILEFSGLATPSLDRTGFADSGNTGVTTLGIGPTAALNGVGDLVVSAQFMTGSVTSVSHSAGFTAAGSSSRALTGWGVDTDQSAKTDTLSWSTSVRVVGVVAAFSPTALASGFTGWGQPI